MKKQVLIALINCISIRFVEAKVRFPPELIQVLEVVKNIDNGLKNTKYQIYAAENQRRSVRGTLLPQINARTYTNLEMTDRLDDDWNQTNISLTFEQTIFSLQEFETYSQEKKRVKLANAVHEENKANLYQRAINTYLDFLKFSELVENARQNVENFKDHYNASKKRNRAGAVSRTDVTKSQERLINSQTELYDFEFQLKAKKDELFQLTRMEASPKWKTPILNDFKKKLKGFLNKKNSVLSNMAIKQLVAEADVSKSQYNIQRYRHLPKLSLFALYDKDYSHEHDIVHMYTASVGVRVTMPIFTGGNIHYSKRSAFDTYQADQFRLSDSILKTQREFHTAMDNLQTREKIQKLNLGSKTLSEKALRGIKRGFLNGTKTSLDVLESKEDLNRIIKKTITTKFDIIGQQFEILRLVGLLDIQFIKRFMD